MTKPPRHCPHCGVALHGPYCSACGRRADGRQAPPPHTLWPYVSAVVLLLVLVGVIVTTKNRTGLAVPAAPVPLAGPGSAAAIPVPGGTVVNPLDGALPDLSAMTPMERFERLFDRVMRASEGGDTAAVATFSPMALEAYGMLPSPDADARFHAGLIRIASGDLAGAKALADTIATAHPGHLFGLLLKGRIAELNRDEAALAAARREFVQAHPAETRAQRPEYPGHQALIDRFLKDATDTAIR